MTEYFLSISSQGDNSRWPTDTGYLPIGFDPDWNRKFLRSGFHRSNDESDDEIYDESDAEDESSEELLIEDPFGIDWPKDQVAQVEHPEDQRIHESSTPEHDENEGDDPDYGISKDGLFGNCTPANLERFSGLICESFTSHHGSKVTSVWDRKHGRQRPKCSIPLLLSAKCQPLVPEALFTLLSVEGGNVAWALEVDSLPCRNMATALQRQTRDLTLRSPERTMARKGCVELIVDKIMNPPLPPELIEYIAELLVPPSLVGYNSGFEKLYENMFLYMEDADSTRFGPASITFNRVKELRSANRIRFTDSVIGVDRATGWKDASTSLYTPRAVLPS